MEKYFNVQDIANYFLSLVDSSAQDCITNLKLQKLCYYAQGIFLAMYGRRLFNENLQAWQHGPVVPSLYHKYKDKGDKGLSVDKGFDINVLPQEIRDFFNDIYIEYGQYSAWRLRDMTHQESPWKQAYNKTKNDTISDDTMASFFRSHLA